MRAGSTAWLKAAHTFWSQIVVRLPAPIRLGCLGAAKLCKTG